ncbi:MAG: chorismate mutase [Thermoproteota archaeon]|jgi:chorismate mutase
MLSSLRLQLDTLTQNYFSLLSERSELVSNIQNLKPKNLNFDCERESLMFNHFSTHIKKLNLKELFSYSLMIESHAQSTIKSNYPEWSNRIHLKRSSCLLQEQINPILLRVWNEESYQELLFTDEWELLLNESFKKK